MGKDQRERALDGGKVGHREGRRVRDDGGAGCEGFGRGEEGGELSAEAISRRRRLSSVLKREWIWRKGATYPTTPISVTPFSALRAAPNFGDRWEVSVKRKWSTT